MSHRTPRSTLFAAGAVGVLALGGMLGLGFIGGDDDTPNEEGSAETTDADGTVTGGGSEDLPELEDGFEAIPAADIFGVIAKAQEDAGSWEVSSLVITNGEETPVARQQLSYREGGADFLIQLPADEEQVEGGLVEGLYVDGSFYLKGLNPSGWDERWYVVPDDDQMLVTFESTLQSSSAANLSSYGEPTVFDVVGVEDVTELDEDTVRAVHYRLEFDPSVSLGAEASGDERLVMDLWVDAEDRPVQVETVISSGGQEYTSALYYSDYGADFDLAAPDDDNVTDRRPKSMAPPEQAD